MPCRICQRSLELVCDFGRMPIANRFVTADEFAGEYFFPLRLTWCPHCTMVQLAEQPPAEAMFHGAYPFFTGSSRRMQEHFATLAATLQTTWLCGRGNPFVVELGSNDGTLLQHFAQAKIRHLGIEPSANVAALATQRGVATTTEFFSDAAARHILAQHGPADVITMSNVLCHIAPIHEVFAGFATLLAPEGVVVIEDPYWPAVADQTAYDQIYDEHLFYFSLASLTALAQQHGFVVIAAEPQWTHGGSMRYTLARPGTHAMQPTVATVHTHEQEYGIATAAWHRDFGARCAASREQLRSTLEQLAYSKSSVMGYAATSKSTTVLNYCGITTDWLPAICDTTPLKQGKFSPGAHIPIIPAERFHSEPPDVALLFGWNHAEEILAKEQSFTAAGGRWLLYVPTVHLR